MRFAVHVHVGPTFSIPIAATCAFCFNPLTDEVNLEVTCILCIAYMYSVMYLQLQVFCVLGSMFSGAVSVLILLDTQHHQNEVTVLPSY